MNAGGSKKKKPAKKATAKKAVAKKPAAKPLKQRSSNGGGEKRGAKGRFLPGNSYRWKAGESGNPKGRKGSVTDAIRQRLEKVRDARDGRTNAELVADALLEEAIKGRNIQAIREILDRMEGKPRQAIDLTLLRSEREKYEAKIARLIEEARRIGESITREKAIELLALEDARILEVLQGTEEGES